MDGHGSKEGWHELADRDHIEAWMNTDSLRNPSPEPSCPSHSEGPPLHLMQALAMQALYQLAFEEAQADAREALRQRRLEPKWN